MNSQRLTQLSGATPNQEGTTFYLRLPGRTFGADLRNFARERSRPAFAERAATGDGWHLLAVFLGIALAIFAAQMRTTRPEIVTSPAE